ncbi:MAG: O-methyltransferase [Labilithrix sp.]|nr:O-methyltransferase [Labilithrix sp.]
MSRETWSAVDHYFEAVLTPKDDALESALAANAAAGLPAIDVSASQGKLLHLLARIRGAKSILEVGTLGGYSAIWLARALPDDGRLVTLEIDPKHAAVARTNLERAGLSQVAIVREGRAIDSLAALKREGASFDFVFIDADKPSNPDYFARALDLVAPGAVIIVDNVVRGGAVIDPDGDDAVQGVRRLHELIASNARVNATAIQTVGTKGWDGFTLALVVA